MNKPLIRIHDLSTNEIIDREMTADELTQWENAQAIAAAAETEMETKAKAKEIAQAKLAALGLNTDDLKALGL
jgi:hypothetical protein